MDEQPPVIQIIIVGDTEVGKTSLLNRWCDDVFTSPKNTVGIDFKQKQVLINDTKTIVRIWDTAGQERFKSLSASFFRKADGIILVYNVNSMESFENVPYWYDSITSNVDEKKPVILIGNKIDMEENVKRDEAVDFASDNELRLFFTSAKTGENIDTAIMSLVTSIHKEPDVPTEIIDIQDEPKHKCKC